MLVTKLEGKDRTSIACPMGVHIKVITSTNVIPL
jgi:hypothetical protein